MVENIWIDKPNYFDQRATDLQLFYPIFPGKKEMTYQYKYLFLYTVFNCISLTSIVYFRLKCQKVAEMVNRDR